MNLSQRQAIKQKLIELDKAFLDAISHHNVLSDALLMPT